MKNLFTTVLLLTTMTLAQAQIARVQAIHNSADAAAATVDVYLTTTMGSVLLIDDFAFRTASPFIDAPAGTPITIGIAPANSTGVGDTIPGLSTTVTLMSGSTYVLIANGIVSGSGYSPSPAFALDVFATGRESASMTGNTDVLVYHGSTDAPTVDVRERTLGATVVDDASYTDFAGYLELPNADYILDVQDATGSVTVASFSAPLATLGLADSALVVLASGFLDPTMNSNGPAFGLYAALPSGGALVALPTTNGPTARAQIIHNSADMAASSVDVYVNGALAVDDFAFRTSTGFIDLPATTALSVGIAPANSTGVGDTIANFNFNLAIDEKYVIVANGIVSGSGYSPAPAFGLDVYAMGREMASTMGNTDVLVYHGATDAPTVDVRERTLGATVVDDASYQDFAGYLELPTADYILDVQDATGSVTVASYDAPLSTLGLGDSAIIVLASGFLDPSMNSNGPAFGLYAALSSGGALVALPTTGGPTARAQIIHNSADAAAATVDVYVNGALAIDDFAFRTTTGFIDLPATTPLQVGIAPGNSMGPGDTIAAFNYNLAIGETYILIAEGIVSGSGYSPATPFDIYVYGMGREEASMMGNSDILVHHGSTDAPTVDIDEVTAGNLVDDISFGEYAGYLELPTADYQLQIKDETGATVVAEYDAPLSTLGLDDSAMVVIASGFLDPSQNSNGPAFGLFVALSGPGILVPLPESGPSSVLSLNAPSLDVYPNPAINEITISGNQENISDIIIYDAVGQVVNTSLYQRQSNTINIQNLPPGVYYILLNQGDTVTAQSRFIKM